MSAHGLLVAGLDRSGHALTSVLEQAGGQSEGVLTVVRGGWQTQHIGHSSDGCDRHGHGGLEQVREHGALLLRVSDDAPNTLLKFRHGLPFRLVGKRMRRASNKLQRGGVGWGALHGSEVARSDLEARHAELAPHRDDAGSVFENGRQARALRRIKRGKPFELHLVIGPVVASPAHQEFLGRPKAEPLRNEVEVNAEPLQRFGLDLIGPASPDPALGAALLKRIQRVDCSANRLVMYACREERGPILLRSADVVYAVLSIRQRAVEIEDVERLHHSLLPCACGGGFGALFGGAISWNYAPSSFHEETRMRDLHCRRDAALQPVLNSLRCEAEPFSDFRGAAQLGNQRRIGVKFLFHRGALHTMCSETSTQRFQTPRLPLGQFGTMHPSFSRLLSAFRSAVPEADRSGREMLALGERLGASSQTITNWKARGVSKEGALKAEEAFGCSPGFILDGVAAVTTRAASERGQELTIGKAALLLARALATEGQTERDLLAHHFAYLIRQGPDERIASAIDALATVDVLVPTETSPRRQNEHPLMGELLDLDQDVLEAVRHIAQLSKTMTVPQRRAMVAALSGAEEATWHTTPEGSSGRAVKIPVGRMGDRPTYQGTGTRAQTSKKVKE